MRTYINVTFNHFRALQAWALERKAEIVLDVRNFQMEVKHRGRYFVLYPMFQGRVEGKLVHTTELTDHAFGFGGWRPYRPVRHTHSTEKRLFKRYLMECGLPTPRADRDSAFAEGPDF